jgi:competence ComEA-like helix-hairpin-helix protein
MYSKSQIRPVPQHRHAVALLAVIFIAVSVGSIATQAKIPPPLHSIELNRATLIEFEQLPETGPKLATAIIRFREKSGPFQRIEDLLAIPGITTKRLEKIRPYVRIDATRWAWTPTLAEPYKT